MLASKNPISGAKKSQQKRKMPEKSKKPRNLSVSESIRIQKELIEIVRRYEEELALRSTKEKEKVVSAKPNVLRKKVSTKNTKFEQQVRSKKFKKFAVEFIKTYFVVARRRPEFARKKLQEFKQSFFSYPDKQIRTLAMKQYEEALKEVGVKK